MRYGCLARMYGSWKHSCGAMNWSLCRSFTAKLREVAHEALTTMSRERYERYGRYNWVWVNTYRYITIVGWTSILTQLWLGVNKRYQGFDPSPIDWTAPSRFAGSNILPREFITWKDPSSRFMDCNPLVALYFATQHFGSGRNMFHKPFIFTKWNSEPWDFWLAPGSSWMNPWRTTPIPTGAKVDGGRGMCKSGMVP